MPAHTRLNKDGTAKTKGGGVRKHGKKLSPQTWEKSAPPPPKEQHPQRNRTPEGRALNEAEQELLQVIRDSSHFWTANLLIEEFMICFLTISPRGF